MRKLLMIMAMVAVIAMAGVANAAPIVQEESAGHMSPLGTPPAGWISYFGNAAYDEPPEGDDGYMYNYNDGIYTPGLTGTYKVETSWCEGHGPATGGVDYFFRSDGTAGSEVPINNADQRKHADGSAGASLWSDYFELGTVALTTSSTFRIDYDGSAISTGLWRFSEAGGAPVPEPAGLGLIGLALLAVRRKRS